jgi:hypothetical protein
MSAPFTIGQKVRLNDYGIGEIKIGSLQDFKDSQNLVVTKIKNIGYSHDPIWVMHVDKPDINKFMLDSTMFAPL